MSFDSEIEVTKEEVSGHYSAMQDSVFIIDIDITRLATETRIDRVKRNIEHLEIMLSKEYWTDEDMTEVHAAIAAGKTYLNQL